jgi:Xaa-Pro aminopeptidase
MGAKIFMYLPANLPELAATLKQRRQRLAEQVTFPTILWSGLSRPRNFAANPYPFRASSHFLYFAGLPLEQAAISLAGGRLELFLDAATASDALWHGSMPSPEELGDWLGADAVHPLAELPQYSANAATLPLPDAVGQQLQAAVLGRPMHFPITQAPAAESNQQDLILAVALGHLRLCQDAVALTEMRQAAAVTVQAHLAGLKATRSAKSEAQIRSAMEAVILGANHTCAYNSIVTVHGEVLHNHLYHLPCQPGDLLLADVGAETPLGWAADVTRTWPVSGQFSPGQRAIYDLVLAAHDACIAMIRPGVEYRQVHLRAAQVLAEGLVDLGILVGNPPDLVERDAHALFFPHGVGHLLGLDVHDMEDLGDLMGYATGRQRSSRFGLGYLRLDRPLQENMVVTIEPGFYQVPAILQDSERRQQYQDCVNWQRLADFADVRGIRIENDVWVTAEGCEVLTAALPTDADEIEALL